MAGYIGPMEPEPGTRADRSMVTGTGEALHRALGLSDAERDEVAAILGRAPNHLELALFGVMWSEHCSYKSGAGPPRRITDLRTGVLVGPGENAGVIDAGDGIAVAIRIESPQPPVGHRALSGAATGVGGILRDRVDVPAKKIPFFKPSKELKDLVNVGGGATPAAAPAPVHPA